MQLRTKIKKIHKIVGLSAATLIIYLSITGLALMYSNNLSLENRFINNDLILSFYNLDTSKSVLVSEHEKHKIFFISGNVYFNDILILQNFYNPTGAIFITDNLLLISNDKKIISYQLDEVTDYSEPNILFQSENEEKITLLGLDNKNLIYFILNKNYYLLDTLNLKFLKKNSIPKHTIWSVISYPDKKESYEFLKIHQGPGVSLLRIFTEMHNGKIFGIVFTTIISISSFALIFLSLSGIYMGLKFRKKWFKKR